MIGLRQSYTGKNRGGKLLTELEDWAKNRDISRIELSVMVDNTRAISLYKGLGYEVEGTKRNSVRLKGGIIDEYIMAKLI